MQLKWRGIALLAPLAVLAFAAPGCNKGAEPGAGGGATVPLTGTDAVATVNGQPISQSEFYTQLQNYQPNPQNTTGSQPAGRAVLQQLVQNALVEQMAKAQGVAPTAAQIDAQLKNTQLLLEAQNVKPFDQILAENGLTLDQYKEMNIQPQVALLNLLSKGVSVTDADIKAYYDVNKSKPPITQPDRAHIKRIVLADKTLAQQIYDQIKSGKQFETFVPQSIAKQPADGDLPQWVPLDTTQDPTLAPLVKAIKAAKPSETTPPFQFQGGWWLIKVVETKPKTVLPLDQVTGLVRSLLLQQKVQQDPSAFQTFQQQLRDFQAKANIDIKPKQYAELEMELKNPPPAVPPAPAMGGPGGPPAPAPAAPAPKGKP